MLFDERRLRAWRGLGVERVAGFLVAIGGGRRDKVEGGLLKRAEIFLCKTSRICGFWGVRRQAT
jgi:hypothetical protein